MSYIIRLSDSRGGPKLRAVWITDLHLDTADRERVRRFFDIVLKEKPDLVLIGGDISNGVNSLIHLRHLGRLIQRPFYFVLGNHDFYFGSIRKIRQQAEKVCSEFQEVHYLTTSEVIPLTPSIGLIGHDGWYDAKAGDFLNSPIMLHDYFLIDELKDLGAKERKEMLHQLGEEAAILVKKKLLDALASFQKVIILTHVPPFEEACLYEGEVCGAHWAPHFVWVSLGQMLKEVLIDYPDKEVLVLSGHSHCAADCQISSNLRVITGECKIGAPSIQGIIEIG